MLRKIFQLFLLLSKLVSKVEFIRKFGLKFPLTNKLYFFIFNNLRPTKNTVIEVQGSKMLVDPRHGLGSSLWQTGIWEKTETKIIQEYIKEGTVFVDIGANIGYYSLLAARRVGQAGKVYAFEPEPENYAMLVKNMEFNCYRNIVAVRKAVSNRNGVAEFLIDAVYPTQHRLHNSKDKKDTIEVDVITLDNFFKDKGHKIDLIKMDIEGAEMFALEGMQKILNENENLVIVSEFNPRLLKKLGVRPEDYLQKLAENGFNIYKIDEQNQAICDLDFTETMQEYGNDDKKWHVTILCEREAGS
jgi:FkbM family methyltransferase